MPVSQISGTRVTGICCAVPKTRETLADGVSNFSAEEIQNISKNIGVEHRHIAPEDMCVSDLCYEASEKLFAELDLDRESVDALIYITQGPDYIVPATSCVLQNRLNLKTDCIAFDVNLGCSAYPYGIWMAANFIHSGSAKKVLLLAGDLSNRKVSKLDRSTALLFGDAASATLIESSESNCKMTFVMGTDGSGYKNLIIPAGSFRNPSTEATRTPYERKDGNVRSDEDLYMNGAEIFTFTLRVVAPMVKRLLKHSGSSLDDIDYVVMHQANTFIIKHLSKKLKLPAEKVPNSMKNFGNTSSASIPITMVSELQDQLIKKKLKVVLTGFGVGYSWSAVELETDKITVPEILFV